MALLVFFFTFFQSSSLKFSIFFFLMADEPFSPYVGTLCRTTNHITRASFLPALSSTSRQEVEEEEPNHHSVMSTLEGLIHDYSLRILLNIFYRYNLTRANKNIQQSFKELKVKQSVNISDHPSCPSTCDQRIFFAVCASIFVYVRNNIFRNN